MLSSTGIRLSVMTTNWSSQGSGFVQSARASGSGTSAATGGGASASAGDLRSQLKALLEQDVDYQILRKVFALDRETTGSSRLSAGSLSVSGWHGRSLQALEADGESTRRSVQSSVAAVKLDLSYVRAQALQMRGVTAADGSSLVVQTSSLQTSSSVQLDLGIGSVQAVRTGDPLVLDLDGTGVTTTGVADGVSFDLDGDGRQERVSFATGGSWMLALDRDGNARIDDGRELFGDQNGAAHGFAELARYDDNADGRIDAQDEVYAKLRLLQVDEQGRQVTQSLAEGDVTAIELGYQNVRKAIDLYDSVAQSGRFQRADGTSGEAADVLLGYQDLA